jgi:putative addiction module component (TIGR02574 family)
MTADIRRIIEEAMQLDSSAQAFIVETLLESLEVGTDFEVSAEWRAEIRRRCAEIDSGTATLIPGDQALAELRAKHGA